MRMSCGGVVWIHVDITPGNESKFFFPRFVGGKIANLSIFAYMAAILNSDTEWSLKEYCSHRCLAHSEMLICMMMSLRDSCASNHLKKRAIHVGRHDPSKLNEQTVDRVKTRARFKKSCATPVRAPFLAHRLPELVSRV